MGSYISCFSSSSLQNTEPAPAMAAQVILADGRVLFFTQPIKVIHLLLSHPHHFLCQYPSPWDNVPMPTTPLPLLPDHQLQLGQLYHLIPCNHLTSSSSSHQPYSHPLPQSHTNPHLAISPPHHDGNNKEAEENNSHKDNIKDEEENTTTTTNSHEDSNNKDNKELKDNDYNNNTITNNNGNGGDDNGNDDSECHTNKHNINTTTTTNNNKDNNIANSNSNTTNTKYVDCSPDGTDGLLSEHPHCITSFLSRNRSFSQLKHKSIPQSHSGPLCNTPELHCAYQRHVLKRAMSWKPRLQAINEALIQPNDATHPTNIPSFVHIPTL